MCINYNEKIEKINTDRLIMLKKVKELIVKDNDCMSDNIESTISFLIVDEQNVNEYKAILKAKNLILDLIIEITMATSIEDVIKLRNKINYQISKIKKELSKRNINQALFEQFYSKITELRKNISMYLRFLKRESILIEIKELYDRIDDLSDEDRARLKKILSNELKYNKNVLQAMDSNSEKILKKNTLVANDTDDSKEVKPAMPTKNKDEDDEDSVDLLIEEIYNIISSEPSKFEKEQSDDSYLKKRIEYYLSQYNFHQLCGYNRHFLINFINFLKNIPKYIRNKNIIKAAQRDYNTFYSGEDLAGFIDYSKKRNSVMVALKAIFKSSRLSQREIECLYDHNKCMEWIMEFYNYNDYISSDSVSHVRTK